MSEKELITFDKAIEEASSYSTKTPIAWQWIQYCL
jgi:hypothetical protein